MTDLAHVIGSDLSIGPTGDLALSTGTQAAQERVLRRLLTNAGAYIWHPAYGAGLPAMVGTPANIGRIRAITRGQMLRERGVARTPAPIITVSRKNTSVFLSVRYADRDTGQSVTINTPV
jgi:hypothetical protein